jgi:hypothetical protein
MKVQINVEQNMKEDYAQRQTTLLNESMLSDCKKA